MLEKSGKPCCTTALPPQLPEAEASGPNPAGTAAPQRLSQVPSNTPGWHAQLSQEGIFSWLTTHSLHLRAGSLQCPKAPSACIMRPCT